VAVFVNIYDPFEIGNILFVIFFQHFWVCLSSLSFSFFQLLDIAGISLHAILQNKNGGSFFSFKNSYHYHFIFSYLARAKTRNFFLVENSFFLNVCLCATFRRDFVPHRKTVLAFLPCKHLTQVTFKLYYILIFK
jgi:hypothetical protein